MSSPKQQHDILSSQPDWLKKQVVDFLPAKDALALSATCRGLRVVKLVDKATNSSSGDFWTGYCHICVRWQWLLGDRLPSKVHSTLVKVQAWEAGADSRDGRLMVVATDKKKECSEVGCWKYLSLPEGQIVVNNDGINVAKTIPNGAKIHCEFRPNPEKEYSVWICRGGGGLQTNVVHIRQFAVKDLVYMMGVETDPKQEQEFLEWQAKRSQEWDNYETKWHRENPPVRNWIDPEH